jgi:outer membrane protein assembly factor BamB
MTARTCSFAFIVLALCALAADWPQFLGPNRNGASSETGLLSSWTGAGPKVLWKVEGGDGYSGIAVAGGKAYTQVQRGGDELLVALDANTGKEVWKHKLSPAYKNQYGNGPRSTPTIEGGKVYVRSINGPLVCLEAGNGKVVWQQDLFKDFNAKNIDYGIAASPLIEGDLVLALPGSGGGLTAFNKTTGKLAWKVAEDSAAYSSPIAMTVGGKKQLIFFTAAGVVALETADGKELWRVPWKTDFDCNIATPLIVGQKLFVSSGESVGCAMLEPSLSGAPKVVWESKGPKSTMMNYWSTCVLHDNHLYGMSGEYGGPVSLVCIDTAKGERVWAQERFGHANLTLADGNLYIVTVKGELVVAPATPKGYQEKGRATILEGAKHINAPAIADKKLYVRDLKSIVCVDIAGK